MSFHTLSQHLPVLLIVIPLMTAPLCIMARHGRAAWLMALIANLVMVIMAISLFFQVSDGDVIRYALGGWAAPTGIEYYIDTLNASLLVLITMISGLSLVYSLPTIDREIAQPRHYLFYTGWLLCLTGLLGIVVTGDAFNVFVFLEISSLSMYMLIALGKERRQALMAAFRYLVMGSVGASFILIGIGFLYAATGTLNMLDLADRVTEVSESRTVLVAFSFITLGLLIKAAMFPVYSWLPNAYQYAPSSVTAFLSGTATKVSIYILLRFFFDIFGVDYSFNQLFLGDVLLPLALVGFIVMSVVAILQTDIRRVLAYSSIAQIGYIITGISMATHEGLTAAIIHMINHGFIKAALFMAVGCIIYRMGNAHLSSVGHLIVRMPWTASAFIIAGLSLIGMPLTAGFVSKWHLLSAAIGSDWWFIAGMMLISSLMAIIYIGKIIEIFCFNTSVFSKAIADTVNETDTSATGTNPSEEIKEAPLMMLIPLWVLVGLCLYLGINGSLVVDIASQSAAQLLDGFPVTVMGDVR